jgi:hypothetical protein
MLFTRTFKESPSKKKALREYVIVNHLSSKCASRLARGVRMSTRSFTVSRTLAE